MNGDIIFSVPVPVADSDAAPAQPAADDPIRIGSPTQREVLRLCTNGDIFVRGVLAKNDSQVVDGLREFLGQAKHTKTVDPYDKARRVVQDALWSCDDTRPRQCADAAVDALIKAGLLR
jgi:hypothetical protein